MDPIRLMQQKKDGFSKNDLKIYQTIIADPGAVAFQSTSVLAEKCGVSQPAVTRFVKDLGYEKYQDFRSELVAFLARHSDTDGEVVGHLEYFSRMYALLQATEEVLTADTMHALAAYVCSFKRLFTFGAEKSAYSAKLFSLLVRKLGILAVNVDEHELKDIAEFSTADDLIIIFTVNGQRALSDLIQSQESALLLVTASFQPKKMRGRDRLVTLPYLTKNPEESSVSPVLFSMFTELLVSFMIQERMKKTPAD